ncbi:MAG TPA: flagellar hook basal-body protein [Balneolales bacterium]|nr:flagellar hook basal-body protein [Balneolales bacterium]
MIERLKQSMQALEMLSRAQDVTANNLANINTPGYKAQKLFYQAFQKAVNGQVVDIPDAQETASSESGDMKKTGNPFDVAINGKGFFLVNSNGQDVMSRNGRFHIDSQGYLRDSNDAYVQGKSGTIYLPEMQNDPNAKLQISKDGTITLNGSVVDQLQLVKVPNYQDLKRLNDAYMTTKDGLPPLADNESTVSQGFYESSNVDPLKQMIAMTTNMRLFQTQQKTMQTMDQILGQVTSQLGKF